MKKLTLNTAKLLALIPSTIQYTTAEDITNMIQSKLDNSSAIPNTEIYANKAAQVLTDVYHDIIIRVEVYSDIVKTLDKQGVKYINHEVVPYDIVINITSSDKSIYHYTSNMHIRMYNILESTQPKPWEPMTEEEEANERDWGYGE